MRHSLITGTALVAFAAMAAAPAAAVTYTRTGTTVGGPVFNRPIANGSAAPTFLSNVGTAVRYDSFSFSITAAGDYSFLMRAQTDAYDTYLGLYLGSFDPAAPLTNAIIYNDDLTSLVTSGFTTSLALGQTYTAVLTGFDNADFGRYNLAITGPGSVVPGGVPAVPEAATWASLIVGLGMIGTVMRRRSGRSTIRFA